jgi:hypothetical protein
MPAVVATVNWKDNFKIFVRKPLSTILNSDNDQRKKKQQWREQVIFGFKLIGLKD